MTVMHLQMWTDLEDSINERILKLRSLKRTGYKFLNQRGVLLFYYR